MRDYVMDIFQPRKKWARSVKGFLLPIYAKYTPPMFATLRYPIRMFTTFLVLPIAYNRDETPAWILTLKTSNDAVLRKEVPFEGYKSEITYLT